MNLAEILASKTKNNPVFLHIDSIGLLNFGKHVGESINEILENKLENFNHTLNIAEEFGGNILIPAFSYSTTNEELFDIQHTPSTIGGGMEFLRRKNPEKRSADPMFSYTVFSQNHILQDREVRDYETFGNNDLISKVFEMDGYIGAIGGVLKRMTEAHFLEKKLGVKYRFDKDFFGETKDRDEKIYKTKHRFFCRDLSFKQEADFQQIIEDAKNTGIVEVWKSDGVQIEAVKMKKIFELMKEKFTEDEFYFCRDEEKN
jgi:aminoglycoside N3'-acetyltransferase